MSKQVSQTKSLTVNPSGYTGISSTTYVTNPENGYNSSSNTSAKVTITAGKNSQTNYLYYTFDLSAIPSDATINSVNCTVCASVNKNTSGNFTTTIQLYSGTTAKGSALTGTKTSGVGSTSATQYTLTCETWTRTELDSLQLYVYGSYSSTNSTYYLYFYGADLTISYTYNETVYIVTISASGDGTASPTGEQEVSASGNLDITLTLGDTVTSTKVLDNDTDVSSSVSSNVYSLSNVNEDHTIDITFVSGPSLYIKTDETTWADVSKVYQKTSSGWSEISISELQTLINGKQLYTGIHRFYQVDSVKENGFSGFLTDYIPNENTELEYKIKYDETNATSTNWGRHFLSVSNNGTTVASSSANNFYLPVFRTRGNTDGSIEVFAMAGGNTEYTHTYSSYSFDDPYVISLKDNKITINNEDIFTDVTLTASSYPFAMFTINEKGNLITTGNNMMSNTEFYYLTIWENDEVVREYIPVYDAINNVFGIYETKNRVFNIGTNGFTGTVPTI